jgi:Ca-activated chloride channel family protein
MRLLLPISVSLLLAGQAARAQLAPADDFFNGGAQFYISNNIPSALEKTEDGLKVYPDDAKLKKLEELLKQQQQQQNQQNQNQQNQSQQQQQNQQNQSQQNSKEQKSQQQQQNQQSSQKNSQDQQKQDSQNQSGGKKDEQQKQQERPKPSGEKKDGEKQDKQDAEGQPVAAGQMTPEEAKRLLDAQKGDEQVLQLKPQGKPEQSQRPVKDW